MFDSDEFNQKLFFPRPDFSEPGGSQVDHFVAVPGGRLHLREHAGPGVPLLFFHGNGEVGSDYDDAAGLFAEAGAALWVSDYRGYGASEGVPTLRNLISDAHALFAAMKAPCLVMGRSLGSAAVAELMGSSPATMLGAIIESGAADFTGLIRRRGMAVPSAFAPEVRAVFDPLPKLARGRVPLLVLHGGADEMISPREAQLTFDAAGTPAAHKTLCLLEGHGHNDVMRAPEYWVALKRFISSLPSR